MTLPDPGRLSPTASLPAALLLPTASLPTALLSPTASLPVAACRCAIHILLGARHIFMCDAHPGYPRRQPFPIPFPSAGDPMPTAEELIAVLTARASATTSHASQAHADHQTNRCRTISTQETMCEHGKAVAWAQPHWQGRGHPLNPKRDLGVF